MISLGLFRAASTWAYNVVADVMRSRHGNVGTIFAEDVATLAAHVGEEVAIVKSHVPTADMRLLVSVADLATIVSVRDPLDCVASLMERFGERYETAFTDVAASADALLALLEVTPEALVLRYEDEDARSASTVRRIAEHFGIVLPPGSAVVIANRYEHAAVRAHIEDRTAAGAFDDRPARDQYDPHTHWHPGHLGSGASGRHAAVMSPAQTAAVAYATRRFRDRFGYDALLQPIASGSRLAFAGAGLVYCERGFDRPEDWGVWTAAEEARLRLPLAARSGLVRLTLHCSLAPVFASESGASAEISLEGVTLVRIVSDPTLPDRLVLALAFDAKGAKTMELVFLFVGLLEVDPRRLGLGLRSLDVQYEVFDDEADT